MSRLENTKCTIISMFEYFSCTIGFCMIKDSEYKYQTGFQHCQYITMIFYTPIPIDIRNWWARLELVGKDGVLFEIKTGLSQVLAVQ